MARTCSFVQRDSARKLNNSLHLEPAIFHVPCVPHLRLQLPFSSSAGRAARQSLQKTPPQRANIDQREPLPTIASEPRRSASHAVWNRSMSDLARWRHSWPTALECHLILSFWGTDQISTVVGLQSLIDLFDRFTIEAIRVPCPPQERDGRNEQRFKKTPP